jgi:hypothetical protein
VQVEQEQGSGAHPRNLVEAEDTPAGIDQPDAVRKEDSDLLKALDFLDACLLPEPHVERGLPPADPGAKFVATAETTASGVTVDDHPLQTAAAPAAPAAAPADQDSRAANRRIPRGLLYWFGVGIAGGATWRLTSSLYEMTVAALAASAALIGLELLLRLIDPRLARRLGFARPHQGSSFYGAGAVLGVGTGLVIAHII